MKMKLGATWCYLLFMLINHKYSLLASAKSLETQNLASCHEHVGDFFKSFLNVTIQPSNKVGKYSKVWSTPSRLLSASKPIFRMLCCARSCSGGLYSVCLFIAPAIHHLIYIDTRSMPSVTSWDVLLGFGEHFPGKDYYFPVIRTEAMNLNQFKSRGCSKNARLTCSTFLTDSRSGVASPVCRDCDYT